MEININAIGNECLREIKQKTWFPYKSGNLKFHATSGEMVTRSAYCIKFDSTVAPYVAALEEGSKPHNIPGAFGNDLPFGIGGRFNGRFHPGSTKHRGFISEKCVNTIIRHICSKYNGEVR